MNAPLEVKGEPLRSTSIQINSWIVMCFSVTKLEEAKKNAVTSADALLVGNKAGDK